VTTVGQSNPADASGAPAVFVTTHWSVVLTAARSDSTQAREALGHLCRLYWYPIYYFVRRQGYPVHDAQDLTQEFFARLLEKHWIASADQSRGRFRSFLLMILKRFLAGEWHKAHAQKRSGGPACELLPLDAAETRYSREPADPCTPEDAFEKQWALTLLENVMGRLRADYEQDGRGLLFETLKPCLMGSRESQPYTTLAAALGMSEGAVKVAVHRLRERYRDQLRVAIAGTVAEPGDVDAELKHLFRVLARNG
jgi:RNA polymerase sigma-70 factor (ECF subfamily)